MNSVSIVIPVYRSSSLLEELFKQLIDYMQEQPLIEEVILVCDGSPDDSWEKIKIKCKQDRRFKGIKLRNNFGQHQAILVGFRYASGDFIVTMDDDLQHDPREIRTLIHEAQKGYDVVYGIFYKQRQAWWKILGSKFNSGFMSLIVGGPKNLKISSFRLISRSLALEIAELPVASMFIDSAIFRKTRSYSRVSVKHRARPHGESNYGIFKSISLFFSMLTNLSIFPLRLVTIVGIIISTVSMVLMAYLAYMRVNNESIPNGWTSLAVITLFLGGLQLLGVGILGEYLGRIFGAVTRSERASISEKVGIQRRIGIQTNFAQCESCEKWPLSD